MASTFRRKNIPSHLKQTGLWRSVDVSEFPDEERQRFSRYFSAISDYLNTSKPVITICEEQHMQRKEVIRAANRCLTLAENGQPIGWPALIKFMRVRPYRRDKEIPSGSGLRAGYAGAFQKLLVAYPEIRRKLVARALGIRLHASEVLVRKQLAEIHGNFTEWCNHEGIKAWEYPLCTASQAKQSMGRFIRQQRAVHLVKGLKAQNRKDAAHKLNVGTGHAAHIFARAPMDVAQMDEHRIHMVGTIEIADGDLTTAVPIGRMTLILISDVGSQAVLGYSIAVRREANKVDVLYAIASALEKWQPRTLHFPGLKYPPGAGLPSGIIAEFSGAAWNILQVDNALVHYATEIIDRIRLRVGCAINYGPFATWERRPIVESVFSRLEERGFLRVVCNTGTGPSDDTRGDANAEAVKHRISYQDLIDLVDVVIAQHNATPIPSMGMKSPLDILRDYAACQDSLFMVRTLPPAQVSTPDFRVVVERHFVRGNIAKGIRPYIQIDTHRYTSPLLSQMASWIGMELVVHISERDMRSVRTFFPKGDELGFLVGLGQRNQTPWSREEGRLIRSLIRAGTLQVGTQDDPVEAFHAHLARKAQEAARKQNPRRPKTSAAATSIAQIEAEGRGSEILRAPVQPVPIALNGDPDDIPLGKYASVGKGKSEHEGEKR
jgi:hypothetical protein